MAIYIGLMQMKKVLYIENNIKNQILLNGNVEMELCNYKSQTCGCNYPKNVCENTKIYANEIHKILKNAVKNIIPKDMETRPLTFSASVGNINIAFTHGDEKNLSGWGLSKESLENKHRQIEIIIGLIKITLMCYFQVILAKRSF
ncbi:hypothetical protein [Campylobacter sputorum]|uniref:hypothetical protein n=1 Tax=Campylobacter sputorum TaxID=206 RepID=UPI0012E0B2DF|nr:hypothetical protein [Campylobacter sputorum]